MSLGKHNDADELERQLNDALREAEDLERSVGDLQRQLTESRRKLAKAKDAMTDAYRATATEGTMAVVIVFDGLQYALGVSVNGRTTTAAEVTWLLRHAADEVRAGESLFDCRP